LTAPSLESRKRGWIGFSGSKIFIEFELVSWKVKRHGREKRKIRNFAPLRTTNLFSFHYRICELL
jgi:hypothetical protein